MQDWRGETGSPEQWALLVDDATLDVLFERLMLEDESGSTRTFFRALSYFIARLEAVSGERFVVVGDGALLRCLETGEWHGADCAEFGG